MSEPTWLMIARELQAIAQTGLAYTDNGFDRERYERVRELAASLMAEGSGADREKILELFRQDLGYATPKIDVRGAAFVDGRILMVREVSDGLWTLPGGWADVNQSAAECVVREFERGRASPSPHSSSRQFGTTASRGMSHGIPRPPTRCSSSARSPAARRAPATRPARSHSSREMRSRPSRRDASPSHRSDACSITCNDQTRQRTSNNGISPIGSPSENRVFQSEPRGDRTHDPRLKRPVLYQLS